MIVVDASVALLWLIDLPVSEKAERLLESANPLVAPDLIVAELANAIWKTVASADLNPAGARDFIESSRPIRSDAKPYRLQSS